jgi:hypothetical protein
MFKDLIKYFEKKFGMDQPECVHKWSILLEYYPSFTKDKWICTKCNKTQIFNNDEPPVKIKSEICNLGHLHIIN